MHMDPQKATVSVAILQSLLKGLVLITVEVHIEVFHLERTDRKQNDHSFGLLSAAHDLSS